MSMSMLFAWSGIVTAGNGAGAAGARIHVGPSIACESVCGLASSRLPATMNGTGASIVGGRRGGPRWRRALRGRSPGGAEAGAKLGAEAGAKLGAEAGAVEGCSPLGQVQPWARFRPQSEQSATKSQAEEERSPSLSASLLSSLPHSVSLSLVEVSSGGGMIEFQPRASVDCRSERRPVSTKC